MIFFDFIKKVIAYFIFFIYNESNIREIIGNEFIIFVSFEMILCEGQGNRMSMVDVVDPTAFISAYSQINAGQGIMKDVGTAMLGESLDLLKEQGSAMTKMMEQSVTPYLGGNIDISA